jgi:lipid-A-disaccharide synthase-like uncharacterized protein
MKLAHAYRSGAFVFAMAIFFILAIQGVCSAQSDTAEDADYRLARVALHKQCQNWKGPIYIKRAGGKVDKYEMEYSLKRLEETRRTYVGTLSISTDGTSEPVRMDVRIEQKPHRLLTARFGDAPEFSALVPHDKYDAPEARSIVWTNSEYAFSIRVDDIATELSIEGRLPLPGDMGKDVVWVTGQLQRPTLFRMKLWVFEITMWELLGVVATLVFGSRFLVQWVASERAKKSVVPESFWWVSLAGAILMTVYGLYFTRFAVILGQLMGWPIYIRNIWFIRAEARKAKTDNMAEDDR